MSHLFDHSSIFNVPAFQQVQQVVVPQVATFTLPDNMTPDERRDMFEKMLEERQVRSNYTWEQGTSAAFFASYHFQL